MTGLWRLLCAFAMAAWGHRKQRDKAGRRYVWHLVRVAWLAYGLTGGDVDAAIVGLLHDYLEDVDASAGGTILVQFGWRIYHAVTDLTRNKEQSYTLYVVFVAQMASPLAAAVKLADLLDNTNPRRLYASYGSDPANHTRLLGKYLSAIDVMAEARARRVG